MFINKIFHLHQPVAEARVRLRELSTWEGPQEDTEVHCTISERDGLGRFEFTTANGEHVSGGIREMPDGDPNRILFRSVGGDVDLAGIIELFPIRPNLTEVVLTLDCEVAAALHKAIGRLAGALDRFLNRQLALIEH